MKTRASRAVLKFLNGLITSEEVPIQITVEAGVLRSKLVKEMKANGVKLTKRRKRRKRAASATQENHAEA